VHWEDELLKTTPGQAPLHGARNAPVALNAGFTTCRDMGLAWPFSDIWNQECVIWVECAERLRYVRDEV
jgi:hypothetical protein